MHASEDKIFASTKNGGCTVGDVASVRNISANVLRAYIEKMGEFAEEDLLEID